MKKLILLGLIIAPLFLIGGHSVYAIKLITPFGGQDAITGPSAYVQNIYSFSLGLGALLAMVMIVIGAVQYTVSEAVSAKEDAKDRITKAVLGLVLLLAATLILFTINPKIPKLDLPNLGAPGSDLNGSNESSVTPSFCGDGIIQYPNSKGNYEICDPPGEYTGKETDFFPYGETTYQICGEDCALQDTLIPPGN